VNKMNKLQSKLSSIILGVCAFGCGEASAACDPIDFLVRDFQHVIVSDQLRTAFFLSATKDQFTAASRSSGGSLSYVPLPTDLAYEQAKQSAEKDAQLANFSYNRQNYSDFLAQQMSPLAADAYSSCIQSDSQPPTLQIWYSQRSGDYIFLKALWVGNDPAQAVAKTESKHFVGLDEIQLPTDWSKGQPQQIVVKRNSSQDGLLSLRVGGLERTFIVLKDPQTTQLATSIVSGPTVRITSGGTSDGHSPFCQRRSVTSCVTPQKGGYLVPGSGIPSEVVKLGRVGTAVVRDAPEQICLEFWASTGACETEVSIQGRTTAVERYRP
jgi:hypothetical protein